MRSPRARVDCLISSLALFPGAQQRKAPGGRPRLCPSRLQEVRRRRYGPHLWLARWPAQAPPAAAYAWRLRRVEALGDTADRRHRRLLPVGGGDREAAAAADAAR